MAFGDKLGPLFLQLSDNYTPKSFPGLKAYLEKLPKDVPVFVELRHKEWFADPVISRVRCLSYCMTLTSELLLQMPPDAAMWYTWNCLRHMPSSAFVGNSLHKSDYARCDEWIERLKQWKDKGLKSIWFFMHQHDERHSPELADYVTERLNAALGTTVKRPQFMDRD